MRDTVKEISTHLICDGLLKKFSYHGQRQKLRFKEYDNITKLIVLATKESLRRVHRDIYGKEKVESPEDAKKLYDEIEMYFTKEYIKKAEYRWNQSKE